MANGNSGGTYWRAGVTGAVLAVAVVAVLAGAAYVMGWRATYQPMAASCAADDAIDGSTRQALDKAALDFVSAASGSNPIDAYGMLAGDTKGAITPDQFLAALRPSLDAVAPFSNARVAHAYFVRAAESGANQRVICGSLDRGDHWVAVTAKPVSRQAHVIVDAQAKGGGWAFVLWLVPENGWKVEGFNFTATGMGGKSLDDLLKMARTQHDQHHDFDAVLLYGAAAHLAGRGKDLQSASSPRSRARSRNCRSRPFSRASRRSCGKSAPTATRSTISAPPASATKSISPSPRNCRRGATTTTPTRATAC